MKQRIAEWLNFCGVALIRHDVVEVSPSVQLNSDRYVGLPFLSKATLIFDIEGEYYYAVFPNHFTSESMLHYTLRRNEGGYYLKGLQSFKVMKLTPEVLENELYPIPPERRMEREAVMAKYKDKPKYTLPFNF